MDAKRPAKRRKEESQKSVVSLNDDSLHNIVSCLEESKTSAILSLNDDCLHNIVSYLDDRRSFHSFALTCKKFLQMTKRSHVPHPNVLALKAEYYIKCYTCDEVYGRAPARFDRYSNLAKLLHVSSRLSYANVVNMWQKNGPVAAKLFTWITNQQTGKLTLHLPSSDKSMVIDTIKNVCMRVTRTGLEGTHHIREHSILVTCGDVITHAHTQVLTKTRKRTPDRRLGFIETMKPVIKLLQEELGDTIPPITDCFFVWLCTYFPDEDNWLDEEHKLSFKDTVGNEKPSLGSVQSAIDLFHQNFQAETKLQNDNEHESNHFKMIAETIHCLARRSETVLLEKLERDTATLCETARHFELKFPNQLLLDLFLRTSLEAGNYSPGSTVHQFVESSISFRCLGGKVVKLWGGMHGDISLSYPIWDRLELKFTLPDGKELKIDTGFVDYIHYMRSRPLLTEQLSPVTELLQECTNQSMQGEKHIPRIDNLFTATYFLNVLGFSRPGKVFLEIYGN